MLNPPSIHTVARAARRAIERVHGKAGPAPAKVKHGTSDAWSALPEGYVKCKPHGWSGLGAKCPYCEETQA